VTTLTAARSGRVRRAPSGILADRHIQRLPVLHTNGRRFRYSGSSSSVWKWDTGYPTPAEEKRDGQNAASKGRPEGLRSQRPEKVTGDFFGSLRGQSLVSHTREAERTAAKAEGTRIRACLRGPRRLTKAAFHSHRSGERTSLDVPRPRRPSVNFVCRGFSRQNDSLMPARKHR
jgi:hypothetical protein